MKKMFSNIKKIFNKEYLKENIGVVFISLIIFVFIVGLIVYFLISRNVSKIEVNKINELTEEKINFIDDIVLNKGNELDKYIVYSLNYSYNVNSKNKMTSEEISAFIKETFNKKVSSDEIKDIGVTSLMVENNITYNSGNDEYVLNIIPLSAKVISTKKIVYYKQNTIKKNSRKKYTVTYTKYVINNPYDLFNYYLEKNQNEENPVDYTIIRKYLTGEGKLLDVKHFIKEHEEDLKEYSKKEKNIKITYIVKGDNLLIDKIKG